MNNKTNLKLQALICIIRPDLENALVDTLYQNNARGINILIGHGLKKFQLLDALGLSDNHKTVVLSFIKSENEKSIMEILKEKIFIKENVGIAFTIDVDGFAGGRTIFEFYDKFQDYIRQQLEKEEIPEGCQNLSEENTEKRRLEKIREYLTEQIENRNPIIKEKLEKQAPAEKKIEKDKNPENEEA